MSNFVLALAILLGGALARGAPLRQAPERMWPVIGAVSAARRRARRRAMVGGAVGGAGLLLARLGPAAAQSATPAPTRNLVDAAVAAGQFTVLLQAVQVAGLTDTLKGPGPFTVFGPTDAAFARVPANLLNAVLADNTLLTKVLTYHVVAGSPTASNLQARTSVVTVEGEPVRVTVEGSVTTLNISSAPDRVTRGGTTYSLGTSARVVMPDILATSGVLHGIDAVLVPPSLTTAAAPTVPAATPTPPPSPAPPAAAVARDGQSLAGQPANVRQLFASVWGDRAGAQWADEHNAELARSGR